MQGGKNWILPKEMNANRFFWDSHWLEIWKNHLRPSMGPNGGSVAMDSDHNPKPLQLYSPHPDYIRSNYYACQKLSRWSALL